MEQEETNVIRLVKLKIEVIKAPGPGGGGGVQRPRRRLPHRDLAVTNAQGCWQESKLLESDSPLVFSFQRVRQHWVPDTFLNRSRDKLKSCAQPQNLAESLTRGFWRISMDKRHVARHIGAQGYRAQVLNGC